MGDPGPQEDAVPIAHARVGRGDDFRKRLFGPVSIVVALALIGFCAFMLSDGGGLDSVAFVLVIGFTILIRRAWKKATKDARDDFFFSYAECRGLGDAGTTELPPAVPLLRAGDRRQFGRLMSGRLAPNSTGTLGHYVFEDVAGKDENERVIFHEYSVVVIEVPEVGERLNEFYCEVRSGMDNDRAADYPLPGTERFSLESTALAKRYDMRVGIGEDEILLRRVFAPSFIVWLAEQPPDRFGFELCDGMLCCFVPRLLDTAEGLDGLVEAATVVAERLAGEVRELTLR
ncbi:MAG: hypothetical protein ACSLFI_01350 [Solirubrobacterales bacterium]